MGSLFLASCTLDATALTPGERDPQAVDRVATDSIEDGAGGTTDDVGSGGTGTQADGGTDATPDPGTPQPSQDNPDDVPEPSVLRDGGRQAQPDAGVSSPDQDDTARPDAATASAQDASTAPEPQPSDAEPSPEPDEGPESDPDAGVDATLDASTGATPDASVGATPDAGAGATPDAAVDGATDAGGSEPDDAGAPEPTCDPAPPCVCPHEAPEPDARGCIPESCPFEQCAPDINCRFEATADSSYYICDEQRDWMDAYDRCDTRADLQLAAIESEDEDDFLLSRVSDKTWISGNDLMSEGTFVWGTGQVFFQGDYDDGWAVGGAYTNFLYNEPNNRGVGFNTQGDCMILWPENDSWADANCSDAHGFICEVTGN